jgi:hypothetical protein
MRNIFSFGILTSRGKVYGVAKQFNQTMGNMVQCLLIDVDL